MMKSRQVKDEKAPAVPRETFEIDEDDALIDDDQPKDSIQGGPPAKPADPNKK